jgi:hypothetical protein
LYLAKPLVKLNIKECLSLDLINFVSIDDFPFYMRWGNAGVTSLNHIMDTVLRIRKYIDQSAMSIPSISSHFKIF